MAARARKKRLPRRLFVWMRLRLANLLLPSGDGFAIRRVDIETKQFISEQDVHMVLMEWASNTVFALCQLTHCYQGNSMLAPIFVDDPAKRILPSRDEITGMVGEVVNVCRSRVKDYQTQNSLSDLKNYILKDEFVRMHHDIKERVALIKECSNKVRASILFLDELHLFRNDILEWKNMTQRHNIPLEQLIASFLDSIYLNWETFSKEKSQANLLAFYGDIQNNKNVLNTFFNQLCPSKEDLDYHDLPFVLIGIRMAQERPVEMFSIAS